MDRAGLGRTGARTRRLNSLWLKASRDVALREAMIAGGCLLAITFIAGAGAYLILGPVTNLPGDFIPSHLVGELGPVRDVLVAPFARWDSTWYLWAAKHGYGPEGASVNFFPLYPLLVAVVGALGPGDIVAGLIISWVCTIITLRLLWLLTDLEFGENIRMHRDWPCSPWPSSRPRSSSWRSIRSRCSRPSPWAPS